MPATPHATNLAELIQTKKATVAVIGMGYVGLPLVRALIENGFTTIGYDVDESKIEKLRQGVSYIAHISTDQLKKWYENGEFKPTTTAADLALADTILICVPTPLSSSRDPDLSYVVSTAQHIARVLRPGQLICLESTTYPGTTRDVLVPELAKSGLVPSEDFFVAYSPEREDPGNRDWSTGRIPKVVGGIDPVSGELAAALYGSIVSEVVSVSCAEVAEASKILENTYRAVNIALVNELKMLYDRMGIDVWEVIDAAKTKPFGFQAFYPGPGLGGHCIPIDPFYLSWAARQYGMSTKFIELAGEINTHMPDYVVTRIADALNDLSKPISGSKIAILGVAYKPDIDDERESPALHLMDLLIQRGAIASYNDPHIPSLQRTRKHDFSSMSSNPLSPEYLSAQDCVVIVTNHSAYDYKDIVQNSKLVVDTRNATKDVLKNRDRIVKA